MVDTQATTQDEPERIAIQTSDHTIAIAEESDLGDTYLESDVFVDPLDKGDAWLESDTTVDVAANR